MPLEGFEPMIPVFEWTNLIQFIQTTSIKLKQNGGKVEVHTAHQGQYPGLGMS
jgi:hypothetical protein